MPPFCDAGNGEHGDMTTVENQQDRSTVVRETPVTEPVTESATEPVTESVTEPATAPAACPRCGATGEAPCTTPSGKATKTHKGREQ